MLFWQVGVFGKYSEGENDEKQALQLLMELTNDYSLTQMVDKPTREKNIQDLVFTDNPSIF